MPPVPAPVAAAALPMPPVGFVYDDPPPPPPPARTPATAAAWTAAQADALKARVEALEDRAACTAAEAEAVEARVTRVEALEARVTRVEALKARVEALTIECEWWRAGMESVESDTRSYTSAEWDEWRASFW